MVVDTVDDLFAGFLAMLFFGLIAAFFVVVVDVCVVATAQDHNGKESGHSVDEVIGGTIELVTQKHKPSCRAQAYGNPRSSGGGLWHSGTT